MGSIASNTQKNYFAQFKTFIMPNSSKKIHPKTVIIKNKNKNKNSVYDFEVASVFLFSGYYEFWNLNN